MVKRKRPDDEQVFFDPWLWRFILDFVVPRRKRICTIQIMISIDYDYNLFDEEDVTHTGYWGYWIQSKYGPQEYWAVYMQREDHLYLRNGNGVMFEEDYIDVQWMCTDCYHRLLGFSQKWQIIDKCPSNFNCK